MWIQEVKPGLFYAYRKENGRNIYIGRAAAGGRFEEALGVSPRDVMVAEHTLHERNIIARYSSMRYTDRMFISPGHGEKERTFIYDRSEDRFIEYVDRKRADIFPVKSKEFQSLPASVRKQLLEKRQEEKEFLGRFGPEYTTRKERQLAEFRSMLKADPERYEKVAFQDFDRDYLEKDDVKHWYYDRKENKYVHPTEKPQTKQEFKERLRDIVQKRYDEKQRAKDEYNNKDKEQEESSPIRRSAERPSEGLSKKNADLFKIDGKGFRIVKG